MSRYITKLCQEKERLINITRERLNQLEDQIKNTETNLKLKTDDLIKAEKTIKLLQSERDTMRSRITKLKNRRTFNLD
jgi:septal ring factor EnvC (AmiA/AmiB activator)